MKFKVLSLGCVKILLLAKTASADQLLVPDQFQTIQSAVDAAAPGDEIVVAPGTYQPFAIDGKSITVRSGDITLPVVVDGQSTQRCLEVFNTSEPGVVIEGLSFVNGWNVIDSGTVRGGGVVVQDSHVELKDVVIENCRIERNGGPETPNSGGAGMFASGSVLNFERVRIDNNSALINDGWSSGSRLAGAGLYAESCEASFSDCSISDNYAYIGTTYGSWHNLYGYGAGASFFHSSVSAHNSLFNDNEFFVLNPTSPVAVAGCSGGGICAFEVDSFSLTNCEFQGNILRTDSASTYAINYNYAGGGGLYLLPRFEDSSPFLIENCLIQNNIVNAGVNRAGTTTGCGISVERKSPILIRGTTVKDNVIGPGASGTSFGYGLRTFGGGDLELQDCIICGNGPTDDPEAQVWDNGSPVTYSGSLCLALDCVDCPVEPDCDGDGTSDANEIASGEAGDVNQNGLPDNCEPDCDGDLIPDFVEILQGAFDCNVNGIPDSCDVADGTSEDVNGNTFPDECETDCNSNGVFDFLDLIGGTSLDCDGNNLPDECDIADGTQADCNGDGVPDVCTSFEDCNANGIPDECDVVGADCNGNGIPDDCEQDTDGDTVPDVCDDDVDGDGIPNECDVDQNPVLPQSPHPEAVQWSVESGGNGHWYAVLEIPANRSQLFEQLGLIGASGASITSSEENNFVKSLASQYTDQSVLLGAEESGENDFSWMDGSPFIYHDFEDGQPDGSESDEWIGYYLLSTNGRWHDLSFTDPQVTHYVVEWSNFEVSRLIDPSVLWGFPFDSGFDEARTGIQFFGSVEGNPQIIDNSLSLANSSSALVSDLALIPSEGESFAISVWVRDDLTTGIRQALSQGKMNILDEEELYIGRYNSDLRAAPFADVTLSCSNTSALDAGAWQHLVMSFDSESAVASIYMNGGLIIEQTICNTGCCGDNNGLIVGRQWNGGEYWGGEIDQLIIFNRPLTPDEAVRLSTSRSEGLYLQNTNEDCNLNGVLDSCEIDSDDDSVIDECDPDDDNDGVPDECDPDVTGGADCDTNGIDDLCELGDDCNSNSIPDRCESDLDEDGVIDDCDLDDDGDGVPDECDPRWTGGEDCDANGVDDTCEPDLDEDGTIDACDSDIDGDGILNNCDVSPIGDQMIISCCLENGTCSYITLGECSSLGGAAQSLGIDCFMAECPNALEADWIVDDDFGQRPDADFSSIQEAVDAAQSGDLIVVYPGVYHRSTSDMAIDITDKDLKLYGFGGEGAVLVDGQGSQGFLECFGGVSESTVVRGFTFTGGNESVFLVHLVAGASPVVQDCNFVSTSAGQIVRSGIQGGSPGSETLFLRCRFEDISVADKGLYADYRPIEFRSCEFFEITSENEFLFTYRTSFELHSCVVDGVTSNNNNLFVNGEGGFALASSCVFTMNHASNGVLFDSATSVNDSLFCQNLSPLGNFVNLGGNTSCLGHPLQWTAEEGGNGHWYLAFEIPSISWPDAQSMASQMGGHLASLTSAAENQLMLSMLPSVVENPGQGYWIGAQSNGVGSFEWVTGEPFEFTSWGAGACIEQPDGRDAVDIYCVNATGAPAWSDDYFDWVNSKGFVVEWSADCNNDGIVDFGQILDGTFADEDRNGVPDCFGQGTTCSSTEFEDCNANDVLDSCELEGNDCNTNHIPDDCEGFEDCNSNGTGDVCDIASGASQDINQDGVPDECQCIADIISDGVVDFQEVLALLNAWGPCGSPCPPDINADGEVSFIDLLRVLEAWGPCDP